MFRDGSSWNRSGLWFNFACRVGSSLNNLSQKGEGNDSPCTEEERVA